MSLELIKSHWKLNNQRILKLPLLVLVFNICASLATYRRLSLVKIIKDTLTTSEDTVSLDGKEPETWLTTIISLLAGATGGFGFDTLLSTVYSEEEEDDEYIKRFVIFNAGKDNFKYVNEYNNYIEKYLNRDQQNLPLILNNDVWEKIPIIEISSVPKPKLEPEEPEEDDDIPKPLVFIEKKNSNYTLKIHFSDEETPVIALPEENSSDIFVNNIIQYQLLEKQGLENITKHNVLAIMMAMMTYTFRNKILGSSWLQLREEDMEDIQENSSKSDSFYNKIFQYYNYYSRASQYGLIINIILSLINRKETIPFNIAILIPSLIIYLLKSSSYLSFFAMAGSGMVGLSLSGIIHELISYNKWKTTNIDTYSSKYNRQQKVTILMMSVLSFLMIVFRKKLILYNKNKNEVVLVEMFIMMILSCLLVQSFVRGYLGFDLTNLHNIEVTWDQKKRGIFLASASMLGVLFNHRKFLDLDTTNYLNFFNILLTTMIVSGIGAYNLFSMF